MHFKLANTQLQSRFLLGTAAYPSPKILLESIAASGAQVVTLGLRRQLANSTQAADEFFALIRNTGAHLLPNTAGCKTAHEAIALAEMARELFETNWIKLEVIGDDYTLQADPFELLEAARVLIREGFEVFPYCTDDLVTCQRLVDAGCRIVMPWASPIGSGQGLANPLALETLRARLQDTTLIIDAGIGAPSDAARAMEMGFDGVLLNSAVAHAHDPVQMAHAFRQSIEAGRVAFEAGLMARQSMAVPSTPVTGSPFLID